MVERPYRAMERGASFSQGVALGFSGAALSALGEGSGRRDKRQHPRDKVGKRVAGEEGARIYTKRAPVVEVLFGGIKSAIRSHRRPIATWIPPLPSEKSGISRLFPPCRKFLLRGLDNVRTEWTWIRATFNLRKLLKQKGTIASAAPA